MKNINNNFLLVNFNLLLLFIIIEYCQILMKNRLVDP